MTFLVILSGTLVILSEAKNLNERTIWTRLSKRKPVGV